MGDNHFVVVAIEENPELTLEDVCHACDVSAEFIKELIEHAAIEPKVFTSSTLIFDADQLRRIKRAVHLHQDLEINLAGAALVLDLMDQIDQMQSEIELFKKHLESGR